MELHLCLKGFLVGLAVAIPVGPVVLLCIHRTLNHGRLFGFVSGVGVSSAELCYSLMAGYGVSLVWELLVHHKFAFELSGSLVLFVFGVLTFFSKPREGSTRRKPHHLIGAYFSTFALTMAHPLLFFSFVAIYAGLGLFWTPERPHDVVWFSLSVFAGSVSWWGVLILNFSFFFRKVFLKRLLMVNRISGVLIMLLSLAVLGCSRIRTPWF